MISLFGLGCLDVRCMHYSKTFRVGYPLIYMDKTTIQYVGILVVPMLRRPFRKGVGSPSFPPSCSFIPNPWDTMFKEGKARPSSLL